MRVQRSFRPSSHSVCILIVPWMIFVSLSYRAEPDWNRKPVFLTCCLPPEACCLPPEACCLPPEACCLPPEACCLLPEACCLLPEACCLLPEAWPR